LKQEGLPVSGSKAQLVARLTKGEVIFTVDCMISGQKADFEYDNTNTLAVFIRDLQDESMAWPGMTPAGGGLFVDGGHLISYQENWRKTLSELGVQDGSVIKIHSDVSV
jgi:hypothetical protein